MSRKASIVGLTFDCKKNHLIRAALETIPFQVKAVLDAMEKDTGLAIKELMVNGGITSNDFVMDFLSDLLDNNVIKSTMPDISALGAAYLAALGKGLFNNLLEVQQLFGNKKVINSGKYLKSGEYYSTWNQIVSIADTINNKSI